MKKLAVLVLVFAFVLTVGTWAAEGPDQEAKDTAQDKEIKQLKDHFSRLESNQQALPAWLYNIAWFADFRYRYENIDDEADSADGEYNRNRIRARFGMKAKVNDEVGFNLRLGSGSADPASTNQTLGDSWSSKPVWLDRAYLTYDPNCVEGLGFGLGKVAMPFHKQNGNQVVWDDDLAPEGVYGQYNGNFSPSTSFSGTLGGFWVVERHISGSETQAADTGMFGGQFLVDQAINGSNLTGGVGAFAFTNLMGQGALYSEWNSGSPKFFGNSNTGSTYDMEYTILEAFWGWASKVGALPYSVFGSYVKNTKAKANATTGDEEDTGYILGATVGKTKKQWDWAAAYDFRHVKADAVLGQFNDSDFLGGNTGGKGHRLSGALQVHKNTTLVATLFLDNKYDASHGSSKAGKKYNRLQVDLKIKVK